MPASATPRLRVGCWRSPRGDPAALPRVVDEVVAEAVQAERYGFDSFFLTEHHYQADRISSAIVLCAAIAAATERIAIGTATLVLPLYHPVRLAEDLALVDVLSGGRLIVGVGAGYVDDDFRPMGVSMGERFSRTREALEILRRGWSEASFSHRGRYFTLDDVTVYPSPLQEPRPPILLGAWTDDGVRRAARWSDGWIADDTPTMAQIIRWRRMLEAERADGTPPSVVVMRDGWVAETRDEALREFAPRATEALRFYVQHGLFGDEANPWLADVRHGGDLTFEQLAAGDRFVVGAPDDCVEQLLHWQADAGAEHVVIGFRLPSGPEHERVMEAMQLFGETVLPGLRE